MNNIIDHLEKLKHFNGLDGSTSLRQASLKLHMTQGALSKSIKALEDAIGAKLLIRSTSGFSLTKEGKLLMEFSKDMITKCLQIQSQIRGQEKSNKKQIIRIGVYDSIAVYFLPKLLTFLDQIHSTIEVSTYIGTSKELEVKILNNEIDIAIGVNLSESLKQNDKNKITVYNLFEDQFSFYIHPKKEEDSLNLPLIWFPEARDLKDKTCRDHLVKYVKNKKTFDCLNMETVKELCLTGIGIGVLPTRVASVYTRDRRLINISPKGVQKTFGNHEIRLIICKENVFNNQIRLIEDIIELAKSSI